MNGTCRRLAMTLALLLLPAIGLPTGVDAQVTIPEDWSLDLSGRVQSQLRHSSVPSARSTDFLLRRVRLKATLTLNEWLSGRLQPEFAGGPELKDAWVRFTAGDGFALSMGQFKRAFDVFELASSTELSIIERDGRVPGVDACEGVGGACSLSRLSEKLDYAGRDVGLRVAGDLGSRVSYLATVTNGPGAGSSDDNDGKSAAGRLTVALAPGLRLSGNASFRDHGTPDGATEHGGAWGLDLEVGDFRAGGVHVQAGVLGGDNWRAGSPDGDDPSFTAAQAVVSYYRPRDGDGPFVAVEPLARVSWADPNGDAADDAAWILTPGLMLYFGGRNKVGANVDVYAPESGDAEWSLKIQSFLHF